MLSKDLTSKVRSLLRKHPHLRDNDRKLASCIWHKEAGLPHSLKSGHDLLEMYAEGKLTNAESIRRTRQKIQQTHHSEGLSIRIDQREKNSLNEIIHEQFINKRNESQRLFC